MLNGSNVLNLSGWPERERSFKKFDSNATFLHFLVMHSLLTNSYNLLPLLKIFSQGSSISPSILISFSPSSAFLTFLHLLTWGNTLLTFLISLSSLFSVFISSSSSPCEDTVPQKGSVPKLSAHHPSPLTVTSDPRMIWCNTFMQTPKYVSPCFTFLPRHRSAWTKDIPTWDKAHGSSSMYMKLSLASFNNNKFDLSSWHC